MADTPQPPPRCLIQCDNGTQSLQSVVILSVAATVLIGLLSLSKLVTEQGRDKLMAAITAETRPSYGASNLPSGTLHRSAARRTQVAPPRNQASAFSRTFDSPARGDDHSELPSNDEIAPPQTTPEGQDPEHECPDPTPPNPGSEEETQQGEDPEEAPVTDPAPNTPEETDGNDDESDGEDEEAGPENIGNQGRPSLQSGGGSIFDSPAAGGNSGSPFSGGGQSPGFPGSADGFPSNNNGAIGDSQWPGNMNSQQPFVPPNMINPWQQDKQSDPPQQRNTTSDQQTDEPRETAEQEDSDRPAGAKEDAASPVDTVSGTLSWMTEQFSRLGSGPDPEENEAAETLETDAVEGFAPGSEITPLILQAADYELKIEEIRDADTEQPRLLLNIGRQFREIRMHVGSTETAFAAPAAPVKATIPLQRDALESRKRIAITGITDSGDYLEAVYEFAPSIPGGDETPPAILYASGSTTEPVGEEF